MDGSKAASWYHCFLGARNRITEAEVEQRADSSVLVMHDGVTKSIFAHLIPAKGVDFPCCEKVVKMIVKDLDTLGYHRVVFRCDNESSILALLRAVKLAWTGDVVQETSAEGDPQSNSAAESSVNVVKGHVRSNRKWSGEGPNNQTIAARRTIDWQFAGRSTWQRIDTKCTGRRWRWSWNQSACFATTRASSSTSLGT